MINVKMILNLRTNAVISLAQKAGQKGMRDTVVAITRDTVQQPPVGSPRDTGHNARSITAEVSGMGTSTYATQVLGSAKGEKGIMVVQNGKLISEAIEVLELIAKHNAILSTCLLYTSPSPRDRS